MVTSGAADVAGLGGKLGSLEVGRVADLVVMARQDDDAHESVCDSTPADVELVMIGGDVAYGRADWVRQLAADPADPNLEQVVAWGRRMLLDTSFEVNPGPEPTPRLAQIRAVADLGLPAGGPDLGLSRVPLPEKRTNRPRSAYPRVTEGGDHRCSDATTRRLLTLLGATIGCLALLGARPGGVRPGGAVRRLPAADACAPKAKPGTQALGRWVVRTYGGGYGRISASCTGGSVSEHKEGRAFDWTLNAAGRPTGRGRPAS